MDQKGEAILRILSRKAGLPSRTLSKMLKTPMSTVHRRIKKLEHEGVIEGYKALINFEKTPWPIGALKMVNLAEVVRPRPISLFEPSPGRDRLLSGYRAGRETPEEDVAASQAAPESLQPIPSPTSRWLASQSPWTGPQVPRAAEGQPDDVSASPSGRSERPAGRPTPRVASPVAASTERVPTLESRPSGPVPARSTSALASRPR